ncbi:MAG: hypothetical protein AAGN35_24630 [Bacteroidota bacterium]
MIVPLIAALRRNPRNLFLLDGLGALLSAVLLGWGLPAFPEIIGMPRGTLYVMALVPGLFAVYDLALYLRNRAPWGQFVRIIARANWAYCVFSLVLIAVHFEELTVWGMGYFVGEIALVGGLAVVEWRVANLLNR